MNFKELVGLRDSISMQLDNCKKKVENIRKEYQNQIKNNNDKIKNLINEININFLSISIEKALISLPDNAIGSKSFSVILNKKSTLYDNVQFNKIIRFLTFVENTEDHYNSFYDTIKNSYVSVPDKSKMQDLINLNRVTNYEYSLLKILCDTVDKNKVEFNKIYNAIEDRGIFLTASEKFQKQMLIEISDGLEDVVNRIDKTNEYLNDINYQLWSIDENISSSTNEIVNQLGSIDSSIQAGNALSAAQNYQLYRINQNIKATR